MIGLQLIAINFLESCWDLNLDGLWDYGQPQKKRGFQLLGFHRRGTSDSGVESKHEAASSPVGTTRGLSEPEGRTQDGSLLEVCTWKEQAMILGSRCAKKGVRSHS